MEYTDSVSSSVGTTATDSTHVEETPVETLVLSDKCYEDINTLRNNEKDTLKANFNAKVDEDIRKLTAYKDAVIADVEAKIAGLQATKF